MYKEHLVLLLSLAMASDYEECVEIWEEMDARCESIIKREASTDPAEVIDKLRRAERWASQLMQVKFG